MQQFLSFCIYGWQFGAAVIAMETILSSFMNMRADFKYVVYLLSVTISNQVGEIRVNTTVWVGGWVD